MTGAVHGYFLRLFLVCTAACLCDTILVHTKNGSSVSAANRVVCSLCIFITLLSGADAFDLSENIAAFSESIAAVNASADASSEQDFLIQSAVNDTENRLKDEIFRRYGIKIRDIRIEFTIGRQMTDTEVIPEKVHVVFEEPTEAHNPSVRAFLTEILGSHVTIVMEM